MYDINLDDDDVDDGGDDDDDDDDDNDDDKDDDDNDHDHDSDDELDDLELKSHNTHFGWHTLFHFVQSTVAILSCSCKLSEWFDNCKIC